MKSDNTLNENKKSKVIRALEELIDCHTLKEGTPKSYVEIRYDIVKKEIEKSEAEQEILKILRSLKGFDIDFHLLKWCFCHYGERNGAGLGCYNDETMGDTLEPEDYMALKKVFGYETER